ncbi:hypothetical protein QV08_12180 [Gallibacterium salpingitidis]|uniref:ShlB/FhaC/HecB family hemolysin secretion/activation protein n=1 Tax=Gallibacterium salpingitidis TaxID=505341 RepID=UPI0008048B06|nr:ShlB/FhaC/HecB family hemolysin secretion/activation protein [Gallibacterium salpingitidis]OBX04943.1 hypothetical protein QV08_12180 [Gallibacterium salpingitidis]
MNNRPTLSAAIVLCAISTAYANNNFEQQRQQAGALSQEFNQQREQRLDKPAGQLFNNPVKSSTSNKNAALHFQLKQIEVKEFISDKEQNQTTQAVTEDLSYLLNNYLNRTITFNDLSQLTEQITQYYRSHDYLVARAFLPPQEIENGHLIIGLIKGKVGQVTVDNQSNLTESFVHRIANTTVGSASYLAQSEVEKFALLLNDIQGVKPNISIQAGQQQGSTDINVKLQDGKRWKAYLFADNQGTKQTGEYRMSGGVKLFNLAGVGDILNIDLLSSQNARLKSAMLDYSGLIDGYGTRLGAFASRLDYKLGGDFSVLGAKGHSDSVGAYLLHPTLRQPNLTLNTKLTFEHNRLVDSQSEPRTVESISKINKVSLELNGIWNVVRGGVTYFKAGATIGSEKNSTTESYQDRPKDWEPTNRFTLVNLELGYEQALPKNFAVDLNLRSQLSDRNISSSQKMLLGGNSGVRGYRIGVVSVSDGVVGQFALKHYQPLFKDSLLTSSLFYDVGAGKKYHDINEYEDRPEDTNHVNLQSVGVGFQLSSPDNYLISLSYSLPIRQRIQGEKRHQLALSIAKLF